MSAPEEPQPEWSLLPHDPAGFFGLSNPIDRKDLKRAYNKLLRRFKPEKAPEEFQKIRAAYESLDERLRYGAPTAAPPTESIDWASALGAESVDAASEVKHDVVHQGPAPERPAPPPTLEERLENESVDALYAELAAAPDKSPYDYYALALMADVVERDKPLRFAEWLLSGIAKHDDCGPLVRLLHDYVRGPLPDGAEEKLLPAIARVLRGDSFYPLTEPLWLALLRRPSEGGDPVEPFARLLALCERELQDERIHGRMAFYIQLAKATLLVSDHPWPQQTLDYIEANFEHAPPWLEGDLDMLGVMRDYQQVRARFAAKHPLCGQIDAALQAYFLQEERVGDQAVVACQVAIATDLDALEAGFPLDDNDLHQAFFPLWMWVSWDVGERNAPPAQETTGPRPNWQSRVVQLMAQLDRDLNSSAAGFRWTVATYAYRFGQALCYLLPAIAVAAVFVAIMQWAVSEKFDGALVLAMLIVPIVTAVLVGKRLSPLLKEHYWSPFCMRISKQQYDTRWRRPVLLLQERSHLDDREFRELFSQSVTGEIDMSGYINLYVQQDYAPAMLSLGQRFLA